MNLIKVLFGFLGVSFGLAYCEKQKSWTFFAEQQEFLYFVPTWIENLTCRQNFFFFQLKISENKKIIPNFLSLHRKCHISWEMGNWGNKTSRKSQRKLFSFTSHGGHKRLLPFDWQMAQLIGDLWWFLYSRRREGADRLAVE